MKNIISDFLNIYVEEKEIRKSYGDEYVNRFTAETANGKKKISVAKIFTRIFIVFIIAIVLFFIIRIAAYNGFW